MHDDRATIDELLSSLDACYEAREWARGRDLSEETWLACPRGDWMLWLLGRLDADRPRLVLAACGCARLALPLVADSEARPLRAIETAEAWARDGDGAPSLDEVRQAAAYHAAAVAAYYHAHVAAAAAAYHVAAAAVARSQANQQCADVVRGHFAWPDAVALIGRR